MNGLIWGCLVFLLLPWYTNLILILGIPELWAFTVLALATVGFLSNKYWFRTILAIAFGIFIGLVGVNPENNEPRFTLGWFYLEDGIQIMAVAAGLFAIPELVKGLFTKTSTATGEIRKGELVAGMKAVWENRWLALTRWIHWCVYRTVTRTRWTNGRLVGLWFSSCSQSKRKVW